MFVGITFWLLPSSKSNCWVYVEPWHGLQRFDDAANDGATNNETTMAMAAARIRYDVLFSFIFCSIIFPQRFSEG